MLNNTKSDLEELLHKSILVSVHKNNLQLLMIEIYKAIHNLNSVFMKEIVTYKKLSHNLRNSNCVNFPPARTSQYDTENIRFIGQKVWQKLPDEIKFSKTEYF